MRSEPFGGLATPRLVAVLVTVALLVTVAFAFSACRTAPSESAEPAGTAARPTEVPAAAATADVSASAMPPGKTMCQAAEDLAADVTFVRAIDVSTVGVASLLVSVDTALQEARVLAGLAVDEYQPLVQDTIVALQELRDIGEEARTQDTVGAGVATIGAAVTRVGEAMDALELQLRQPCPQQVS